MHTRIKLILMGMVAVLALSLGASAASALRSLSINGPEAGGSVKFSGRIRFHKVGSAVDSMTCNITILTTMVKTIRKAAGTNMGRVVGMAIDVGPNEEHCTPTGEFRLPLDIIPLISPRTAGSARELGGGVLLYDLTGAAAELWRLVYDGFRGTLPNITNIDFHIEKAQLLFEMKINVPRFSCLAEGRLYLTIRFAAREGRTEEGETVTERTEIGTPEEERASCNRMLPATWEGALRITPALGKVLI